MPLSMETFHKSQRAEGPAAVLAIGTATPPNIYYQDSYADFYFRVTNSEHQVWLKNKFKRICEKSEIKKRRMFLTEEILKENPSIGSYDEPSLDARRKLLVDVVPALGAEAASKALTEWNRPKSSITHLIFCTTGAINMPGGDLQVAKLLGLNPFVNRTMLYLQGCSAGGTALRLAKDMAENNKGARVLVVCSEVCMIFFRGPCETNISSLVGPALFGDGAGSIIVGSDPITDLEKPLFQLVSANQGFIPETDTTLEGHLLEIGLTFHLERELPDIIANNLKSNLLRAFKPIEDVDDWNSLFWVLHPGGPLVMKKIETQLNLDSEKLKDTRKILREYGNMSSASVIFILDELQKRSKIEGLRTTGGGLELGVLIGLGPGLTFETIVLRSIPL